MSARHEVWCRAAVACLLLALAGCGGGPSTGEVVASKPDPVTKKKSLDDYMKKSMGGQKGQAGAGGNRP